MHCRCCEVISLLVSRSPSRLSPPQRGSRRIVVCSQSLSILERGDNGGCWTVDVSRFDHVESDVAGVPRMRVQRGYLGSVPSPHHAAAPDMSRAEGVRSAANVNVNGRGRVRRRCGYEARPGGEGLALIAGDRAPEAGGPARSGGDKALQRSGGLVSLACCHVLPTLGLSSPSADRRRLAVL
jgi:hypothetical protein